MRRALIAMLALAALGAAPAHAATVLGAPGPTGIIGSANGSAVQRTSSDVSYTVPAGGVITSWWFTTGTQSGSMRLLVFRPTGVPNQYTVVGRSDLGSVPTADTASPHFATRIAVQAGDLLGAKSQGPRATYPAGGGTDMVCDGASGWTDPALGAMLTTSSCSGGTRINIAAAVEPDADADGYGDETQDACPTDASTHEACPVPAPPPVITTPPATTTPPVTTTPLPPTLSALAAEPATFHLGARTTLSFKLDMAAKVSLSFLRRSPGRRSGRRCVAPTRANRRARACTRERAVGKLSVDGKAGLNRLRFTGRLSARRKLQPGSYRIVIVANAGGKLSKPRSVVVTLLKA